MGEFDDDGDHLLIYFIFLIISSVVSSLFSLGNIYLIRVMKLWNGHIALILAIACSQLIYDMTFAPSSTNLKYSLVTTIIFGFNFFFGITSAYFTNILAITVLYIIRNRETVNILNHFKWYAIGISIPCFSVIILYLIFSYDDTFVVIIAQIYYYVRLVSIAINFLVSGWSRYLVWIIERKIPGRKTQQEEAICVLSYRMLYYPLIQALSRAGLAWYEYVYGFNFIPRKVTPLEFGVQILYSIITPAASIGYFTIFVIMQPKAYSTLKATFLNCFTGYKKNKRDIPLMNNNENTVQSPLQNGIFNEDMNSISPNDLETRKGTQIGRTLLHMDVSRMTINESRSSMQFFSDEELWNIINSSGSSSKDSIISPFNATFDGRNRSRLGSASSQGKSDSFENNNNNPMSI